MQLLKCHFTQLRSLKYVYASRTLTGERHFCEKKSKPDLYGTLGLNSLASQSEIKKAFYDLTFKYHPDRNGNNVDAATKFREVKEAYDILGNYGMRKRYDKGLPLPLAKSNAYSQKPIVEPKVQYQSFFDSHAKPPKFQSKHLPISATSDEKLNENEHLEKLTKDFEDTKGMQTLLTVVCFVLVFVCVYKSRS